MMKQINLPLKSNEKGGLHMIRGVRRISEDMVGARFMRLPLLTHVLLHMFPCMQRLPINPIKASTSGTKWHKPAPPKVGAERKNQCCGSGSGIIVPDPDPSKQERADK